MTKDTSHRCHTTTIWVVFVCLGMFVPFPNKTIFASENSNPNDVFSLRTVNEPLDTVLEKISKASGYKIVVKAELESAPVSIQLKNVTLHEAIRRIFQNYNHVEIWDDVNKKVEIHVMAAKGISGYKSGEGRTFTPSTGSPSGRPSDESSPGLPEELSDHPTLEQIRRLKKNQSID